MKKEDIRIVFMGSPEIAVPSLKAVAKEYSVVGAVTQPDKKAGRGGKLTASPIKIACEELNIPVLQPRRLKEPAAFEEFAQMKPDLIIVMAFGQILRSPVLNLPRFGCLNVHASILPRWRGASPIQAAILHGDTKTGVTIMKMDEGIDTGDTLFCQELDILPDDTTASLSDRIAVLGAQTLMNVLPQWIAGSIALKPQPTENATYTGMIKKEDGQLDFTHPAKELERKVRAYTPWPSASFDLNGTPLKVIQAHVNSKSSLQTPGTRSILDRYPAVATPDGRLVLDVVQAPGKKAIDGKSFLAGYRKWESAESS